ncbi:hypothetical protein EN855_033885, partial [Mesorhizobium sp. M1C.F.Ca.ET.212.01.1.1]
MDDPGDQPDRGLRPRPRPAQAPPLSTGYTGDWSRPSRPMRPSLPPLLTCLLAALPALLSAGCSPAAS